MPPISRVSLQPRHLTNKLPRDEREAVEALEHHLHLRHHRTQPALEILPDGTVGVFLTIRHMQRLLRSTGARKTGQKHAAHVLNNILPALGFTEDTTHVKKPRTRTRSNFKKQLQQTEGGRHAQPQLQHSYWWRIFRLPTLTRIVKPLGAYSSQIPARLSGSASLLALLKCQGLIRRKKRRGGFAPGSVQAAFWATGPP